MSEIRGFNHAKLLKVKEEKGLSYRELAQLTGIPVSTLHRYFNGHTYPRADKIAVLEKALNLEKGSLFL